MGCKWPGWVGTALVLLALHGCSGDDPPVAGRDAAIPDLGVEAAEDSLGAFGAFGTLDEPVCTGATPQACPALDGVPSACYPARTLCSSITLCGGKPSSCVFPADQQPFPISPDCQQKKCVRACRLPAAPSACDHCAVRRCCASLIECRADASCAQRQGPVWTKLTDCTTSFCGKECMGLAPSPRPAAPLP